ncbi:MAG: glutamine--tRNA ligase/YqeY domain fusion protein [Chitinophagales bacterium]|jgi:glutaminyl-tRNA synthetase|nr:glutamine--tRNA ligase/YqeY domain fusion protein [Sphingobacteriales bacterium]
MSDSSTESLNFIEEIIENDLKTGKYSQIITRFPPEPNGYLHLGHASSICLNFGLTKTFPGYTNLRFDDTNPSTEETEYVDSIKEDIKWLGFEWKHEFYASDYFDMLYDFAVKLIKNNLAYVDDSTSEEIAIMKGSPVQPGTDSPYRTRSVEENLDLFSRMKAGEFADGSRTLRAKIDMKHTNMLMRDPVLYRIKKAHHHRTGDKWCIYPMYDFAHGQSDSIENISHSICTMEFIPHRELYDWLIEKLEIYPSHQYEFARRNVNYTVTSKRKLLQLVTDNYVESWDDPRMPTISGLRRRGYPPSAIRNFCERIGIGKRENLVDIGLLEFFVREDLNKSASRVMAVLEPIQLTISNYPSEQTELLPIENNPEDEASGQREVPFSNKLWIEREDFKEVMEKKWFRLAPGAMVRLKGAYIVKCTDFKKDIQGNISEIICEYIPESKSGSDTSGINVKGTIHWVSQIHAATAEVRLYDRLFKVENPAAEEGDFLDYINHDSLQIISKAYIEPSLLDAELGQAFQFIRKGYFVLDKNSNSDKLIFNRTVTLKDNWAKVQGK